MKGFGLPELLILLFVSLMFAILKFVPKKYLIIAIGGMTAVILTIIIVPAEFHITIRSPEKTTYSTMINLSTACKSYHYEYGRWPASFEDLTNNPKHLLFWESTLADGWGRPCLFRSYDNRLGYGRILSLGKDGKPGGKGPNADIEMTFEGKRISSNNDSKH